MLVRRTEYKPVDILLSILCFLSFSGAVATTIVPLASIRETDTLFQTIDRIEKTITELENVSYRMLMIEFDSEISGDFHRLENNLQSSVSTAIITGLDAEVSRKFNNLNNRNIPDMMKLNSNLQVLSLQDNDRITDRKPLIERSLLNQSDTGYSRILGDIISSLSFLVTDVIDDYRNITGEAREYLVQDTEIAFRRLSASFILYPATLVFLLAIVAIRGVRTAREAEKEALERNETLEELVRTRTSTLEQQNKELSETRSLLVEREKFAALGQLVAGVAHEVNTPLGVSVTAASFLSDLLNETTAKPIDVEVFKETTGLILSNLRRASKLIDGFKRVAVDESGEIIRHFDLVAYLHEDLIPSLNPLLHKNRHEIQLDGVGTLVMKKNPGDFAQIVTNLVINASVHGYGADQPGTIRISLNKVDNYGVLVVSDSGKGMEPDTRELMYNPFFTTNRKAGGSGLGLMLVYNLVNQKLKGRIDCETAPGEGTTFTVSFPL